MVVLEEMHMSDPDKLPGLGSTYPRFSQKLVAWAKLLEFEIQSRQRRCLLYTAGTAPVVNQNALQILVSRVRRFL